MKPEEVGKKALPNGSLICYNITGKDELGYIRGIGLMPQALIGYGYIVEHQTQYESYDYPMVLVYEICINLRKSIISTVLDEIEKDS